MIHSICWLIISEMLIFDLATTSSQCAILFCIVTNGSLNSANNVSVRVPTQVWKVWKSMEINLINFQVLKSMENEK